MSKMNMKTVFLFGLNNWKLSEMKAWLEKQNIDYEDIRRGWGYLLAICDNEMNCQEFISSKEILCIYFDRENRLAKTKAFLIKTRGATKIDAGKLIRKDDLLHFDLDAFAIPLSGGLPLELLYNAIKDSELREHKLLSLSKCDDIMSCKGIPDDIKKFICDYFSLRAVTILITEETCNNKQLLHRYTCILLHSFLTRAMIEKLMLLLSKVDDDLDYKTLQGAHSTKKNFKKQAKKSSLHLTKEFGNFLDDVSLLDRDYRTPEIHKMGRVLGLVHQGHFGTLFNEVIAFQNESYKHYKSICDYIRKKYSVK